MIIVIILFIEKNNPKILTHAKKYEGYDIS